MLSSEGKSRRFRHNLQLATFLSFVAGLVNVGGFLSLHVFTTHITGHFANVAKHLALGDFARSGIYLLYILAFLTGLFITGISTHHFGMQNKKMGNSVPMLLEVAVLTLVAIGLHYKPLTSHVLAVALFFAMGLQNALVTKISNAVVRTTNFTGIFTDLGIDLAHLLSGNKIYNQNSLKLNILLRTVIILFFFSACLIGGYLHRYSPSWVFGLAAGLLVVVLLIEHWLKDKIQLL